MHLNMTGLSLTLSPQTFMRSPETPENVTFNAFYYLWKSMVAKSELPEPYSFRLFQRIYYNCLVF